MFEIYVLTYHKVSYKPRIRLFGTAHKAMSAANRELRFAHEEALNWSPINDNQYRAYIKEEGGEYLLITRTVVE